LTKAFLPLGEVVGTHGLRGELRVMPLCDGVDFASQFDFLYWDELETSSVRVLRVREHKNVLLFVLDGVESVGAAEALRGRRLWFRREEAELDDGEVFIAELIGCSAVDADSGAVYGTVTDVTALPANDVWHIVDAQGAEHLFPAVAEMIEEIDTVNGVVKIRPIEGIF